MSTAVRTGALLLLAACFGVGLGPVRPVRPRVVQAQATAQTPIQYLVVIDQEGASFDHYFGTYPTAANLPGQPQFVPVSGTPLVTGLSTAALARDPSEANPFRLDRSAAYTCNPSSRYDDEQRAYAGGTVDGFLQFTARAPSFERGNGEQGSGEQVRGEMYCPRDTSGRYDAVVAYFDGNTVTALWNYAQHFAISDGYFQTTFGQPTLGAIHLIAADTDGVLCGPQAVTYGSQPPCGAGGDPGPDSTAITAPANGSSGTLVFEADPFWDLCSAADASRRVALSGLTIGDLLDGAGVSWGWFQGGFAPSEDRSCDTRHAQEAYDAAAGVDASGDPNASNDYSASREPFQFFQSTANPQHLPPSSAESVGHDDQANHQYDLDWFWQAAAAGNLPAVSFLKAPAYQAGRSGASNPLDEQQFLVDTINRLEQLPQWSNMAIIVTWDDSGGWYDQVAPRRVNESSTPYDFACGDATTGAPARCAYGPRLPILVLSPFAKQNYVSHALTDQTSITRFIEDNWLGGQRLRATSFDNLAGSLLDLFNFSQSPLQPLTLDPTTGEPAG